MRFIKQLFDKIVFIIIDALKTKINITSTTKAMTMHKKYETITLHDSDEICDSAGDKDAQIKEQIDAINRKVEIQLLELTKNNVEIGITLGAELKATNERMRLLEIEIESLKRQMRHLKRKLRQNDRAANNKKTKCAII